MERRNTENNPKAAVVLAFIFIAAMSRALPHPPNFAPITAMALFGGAYLADKRLAYLLPLVSMLASDLLLEVMFQMGARSFPGIHGGMPWVYLSFVGVVALGHLLDGRVSLRSLAPVGLASSVMFFAITNFGVWAAAGSVYPETLGGLASCYAAAIPFFNNTLAGDVFYVAALFGGFALLKHKYPRLVAAGN